MGADRSSLAERAAAIRDDAVATLDELASGSSLCTIAKSGNAFPGGKYHEGRAFVAGEVSRGLRRGLDSDAALTAARRRWEVAAPMARRGGHEWAAYREGGDDALADLGT
ncbi:hypothetical protein JDV09_07085 [Mycobacterium sp. Y57]|uniref:hypothetical protein n=1 Tax=Mycolicibacterium xanthum TaxID=2796469 RepID=UPI001C846A5B|nr:hypothetical protein [Mycolicibacterium xanthum]MBX7431874.1 hypothetical protein [Mycolicibacterium xanthum]